MPSRRSGTWSSTRADRVMLPIRISVRLSGHVEVGRELPGLEVPALLDAHADLLLERGETADGGVEIASPGADRVRDAGAEAMRASVASTSSLALRHSSTLTLS